MKWIFYLLTVLFVSACSQVGKQLPEFNYTSIDGELISSSGIENRPIVINVWATWCGSCLQEIPALNRLKDKYKDSDVVFLAFSDEPKSTIEYVLDRYEFNYTQVPNAGTFIRKIKTRFVKTYPQNIVVNRKGEIVFEITEGNTDIYKDLDRELSKLQN
ncbi:MAG: TlpA family protein disulfide reductase [Bacteroidia bacterium]